MGKKNKVEISESVIAGYYMNNTAKLVVYFAFNLSSLASFCAFG